ncbi:hypothetical protein PT974_05514 [Cladobotryum mycophilum]|uniref:Uncharacterized protein n=1 Tax=Cladobotryum mycophilum TaxID=491253 RepID=A0ABR0SJW0_9HYPO
MAPTSATSAFSSSIFSASSLSLSRPTTRDGSDSHAAATAASSSSNNNTTGLSSKERKSSFSRKASLPGARRRGTWTAPSSSHGIVTDANAPPALPDYALAAAAKIVIRDKDKDRNREGRDAIEGPWSPISPKDTGYMLSRSNTGATVHMAPLTPVGTNGGNGGQLQPSESTLIHQQITELAQKRISTLDYLRRAHEGRIYWFNTYLFDKPDLNRMPGFDPRKLARKATNYLLLGLSIPTINDLYSSTPLEFLRCLNALLSEFDSFQQLHGDHPPRPLR